MTTSLGRYALLVLLAGALALQASAAAASSRSAAGKSPGKSPTKAVPAGSAAAKAVPVRSAAAKATRAKAPAARSPRAAAVAKAGDRSARPSARSVQRGGRVIRVSYAARPAVPQRLSIGQAIGLHLVDDPLDLQSSVALVVDATTGTPLYEKNAEAVLPIASITKVMTAMVVLDAGLPLGEMLEIGEADRDTERHTRSRLPVGTRLSRGELMQLALMASENRAAHALGRHYPGGLPAFVAAMNAKARSIGMDNSRFADPTGLSSDNMSSARDLARLVRAADGYADIRQYSTAGELIVDTGYRPATFRSTNRLVADPSWSIDMQKTGYISEAGKCLVMQARIDDRPVIIVLLDARAAHARFSDAQRLRRWMSESPPAVPIVRADARS
jgi:D-alanyl-D-alanine endopeptidase (penicillin-binding protein 7)